MASKEQLFGPHLRGQFQTRTSEETNPYAGRTSLASGSASVTVSTTLINSNSIVFATAEVGSAGAAVTSGGHIVVNSIVSATSFALARATGTAVPWDDTIMWMIWKTSD